MQREGKSLVEHVKNQRQNQDPSIKRTHERKLYSKVTYALWPKREVDSITHLAGLPTGRGV